MPCSCNARALNPCMGHRIIGSILFLLSAVPINGHLFMSWANCTLPFCHGTTLPPTLPHGPTVPYLSVMGLYYLMGQLHLLTIQLTHFRSTALVALVTALHAFDPGMHNSWGSPTARAVVTAAPWGSGAAWGRWSAALDLPAAGAAIIAALPVITGFMMLSKVLLPLLGMAVTGMLGWVCRRRGIWAPTWMTCPATLA